MGNDKKIKALEAEIEQLKKEKFIYKSIIDEIPGSIYWKDKNGIYMGRNKFSHTMMKLTELEKDSSADSVIGKSDYDYFSKEVADIYRMNDEKVMDSLIPEVKEEKAKLPSGEIITQLSIKKPLFDENNRIIGIIGNTIDITAQKKAERLAIEKEKEKRKSKFFSIIAGEIAHDLRTPLASLRAILGGIDNYIPLLLSAYKIAVDNQLQVTRIRQRKLDMLGTLTKRATKQVDSINHFIDMMLGNLKKDDITTENYEYFPIDVAIKETIDSYPFEGDEYKLVNLTTDNNFIIWCNPLYFKNMLNNLMKNSLYFIKEQQKGNVYIYLERSENYNMLHYKDTAKGASKEVCERLFDGYFSTRKGGTGLGMIFCKSVMDSLKGKIIVDAVEGEYIHFVLKFPRIPKQTKKV